MLDGYLMDLAWYNHFAEAILSHTKAKNNKKGVNIMLNIEKKVENGNAFLVLEGRLDTVTAPELEKELSKTIDGATELTMDFSKLDYISSAGLRVLLSAQKIMSKQGGLKLVGVNKTIMEIFDITGFSDILTIE